MAIGSSIQCQVCGKDATVYHSVRENPPNVCGPCQLAKAVEEKQNHLDSLKQLSIEERIARIEEWIYDFEPYDPHDHMCG